MKFPAIPFLSLLMVGSAPAVTLFQLDDFSAGTVGWEVGVASNDPPTTADTGLSGGPFLSYSSSGTSGADSRMIMWNDAQWAGDYVGAGIVGISFDALSTDSDPVDFRFAFNGPGGWFVTPSIRIDDFAAGPDLGGFFLPIAEADLTHVTGGSGNYLATMSDVSRMEMLSATDLPTIGNVPEVLRGDVINSTLLVDNIRAIPEPGSVALAFLAGLALAARRRRG